MFFYARSDTHFLLYIYDMIRNELVEKSDRDTPEADLIGRVLRKSREQALSRYENPSCDEETGDGSRGWYNVILRQPQALSGEQFAVFRAVWKWRDDLARRTDESPAFVLPQQGVWDVARVLPPDLKALHSLLPRHAWQARSEMKGLWDVVQKAQAAGREGPTLQQFLTGGAKLAGAEKAAAPELGLEEAEVPRIARSHLFGDGAMSSLWEGAPVKQADDYVQLPWQRLYAEKGLDVTVRAQPVEEAAAAEAKPESPKAEPVEEEDTEFTLKTGRKRKRPEIHGREAEEAADAEEEEVAELEKADEAEDLGAAMEVDSSSEDVEGQTTSEVTSSDQMPEPGKQRKKDDKKPRDEAAEEEARQKKKLQKEEKKEKKRAAKAAAAAQSGSGGNEGEGEEEEEEEAFDYSKAKSVLRGKKDAMAARAAAGEKKKYDPFAKGEGIKGARKAPPIRGTRSATFRK